MTSATPMVGRLLQNGLPELERQGIVEHWHFMGEAAHVLLRDPLQCGLCGWPHHWFINRDGQTRCIKCDDVYRTHSVKSVSSVDSGEPH